MAAILIDTGAIFAYMARDDEFHAGAVQFVKQAFERKDRFLLLDLVFAETMTLLKTRLGSQSAAIMGAELRGNSSFIRLPLDSEAEEETWRIFRRYQDKEWSYVDCAILAISSRVGVHKVFTFDHHFAQMLGVIVRPE